MNPGEKVVILGAGVGGLGAAWALATRGYQVTILEKTARLGGLAATLERDGYRYDLGPHNIHTRHGYILSFLERRFTSLFLHAPTFRIHRRGAYIEYPLRGFKVITSLPVLRVIPALASFIVARLIMFAGEPAKDASFEDWICNRFGRVLFREYFHDYPSKVWQLPPNRIDRVVGDKRIPVFNLTELIRSAFLGLPARVDHPEVSHHNYYLKQGIGELGEFLAAESKRLGVTILTETSPTAFELEGDRVRAVTSGTGQRIECDHLLSTIPLNEMIPLLAAPHDPVCESARALTYCATVLLFLQVGRRGVLPSTILYYAEPDVLFSRVCDLGEFSPEMVPEGHTLLCLEFPCTPGDKTWTTDDAALAAHAVAVLRANGLLKEGDVEGSFTERIGHSYPRFQIGFAEHVSACFAHIGRFRNIVSYGRQGGFAYINTDAVLHQSFQAAEAVLMAGPLGFGLQEWFSSQNGSR